VEAISYLTDLGNIADSVAIATTIGNFLFGAKCGGHAGHQAGKSGFLSTRSPRERPGIAAPNEWIAISCPMRRILSD